jgi:hypothetical protein
LAVASACGSAIGADFERPGRTETKKAAPSIQARLRNGEIYSLVLYRISIVTTLIISAEAESFKIKISSALLERN